MAASAQHPDRFDVGDGSVTRTITITVTSHIDDTAWAGLNAELVEATEQVACDYAAAADDDRYELTIT